MGNTIHFRISRAILLGVAIGFTAGCKPEASTPPSAILETWVTSQYSSRIGNIYECVDLKITPTEMSDSEKAQFGADMVAYSYTATLRTIKQGYSLVGFSPTLKYASVPAGFSVPVSGRIGAHKISEDWKVTGYSQLILPEAFQAEIVAPSKRMQPEIVGSVASQAVLDSLKRRLAVR